jgi:hypothetical protein
MSPPNGAELQMKNLKILSVAAALLLGASTLAMAKGGGGHGGGAHSSGGFRSGESIGSSSTLMSVDSGAAARTGAGEGAAGLTGSNSAVAGFPSAAIVAPSEIAPLGAGMTGPTGMTGPDGTTGLAGTTGPAETSSSGVADSCAGMGCRPSAVTDPIGMIAAPPSIMAPPATSGAR